MPYFFLLIFAISKFSIYQLFQFQPFITSGPGVPFIGHRQTESAPDVTPQNAASHLGLFCQTFCLENFHRKIELNLKISPDAPKNESGLTQMITMGKSIMIRFILVKHIHVYKSRTHFTMTPVVLSRRFADVPFLFPGTG